MSDRAKKLCAFAAVLLFSSLLAGGAGAEVVGRHRPPPPIPSLASRQPSLAPPVAVKTLTATILSKSNTYNLSGGMPAGVDYNQTTADRNVGFIKIEAAGDELFRFDGRVRVFSAKGEEISMDDLRVPCTARLHYYPAKVDPPLLYKIEVLSGGGSPRWTPMVTDR